MEGLSATARVTVLAAPTSVSLPETLRVLLGDTCQLTPVRLELVRKTFADAGLRVLLWSFEEKELEPCQDSAEKKC